MNPRLPEKEFLENLKTRPFVSSDIVAIKDNKILLVKRNTEPFKNVWCLPGGMMDNGENIEQTALRELKEETGATGKILSLIGVYSGIEHGDPRGTALTVAYLVQIEKRDGKHDNEVLEVKFFPFDSIPKQLAFDHPKIIRDALKLLRKR